MVCNTVYNALLNTLTTGTPFPCFPADFSDVNGIPTRCPSKWPCSFETSASECLWLPLSRLSQQHHYYAVMLCICLPQCMYQMCLRDPVPSPDSFRKLLKMETVSKRQRHMTCMQEATYCSYSGTFCATHRAGIQPIGHAVPRLRPRTLTCSQTAIRTIRILVCCYLKLLNTLSIVRQRHLAHNTCIMPQAAYRSCSGAVHHRQSGRTAYRP